MIRDTHGEQHVFEGNRLLYGMGVVDILGRHRCTDAMFFSIGQGACEALKAAGICGWYGPEAYPAAHLIERLKRGELKKAGENVCDH